MIPSAGAHNDTEASFTTVMSGTYGTPVPFGPLDADSGTYTFEGPMLVTGRYEDELMGGEYTCNGELEWSGNMHVATYDDGSMDCTLTDNAIGDAPARLYFDWGAFGPVEDALPSGRVGTQVALFGDVDDVPQGDASRSAHIVKCEGNHSFTDVSLSGFTAGVHRLDCEIDITAVA